MKSPRPFGPAEWTRLLEAGFLLVLPLLFYRGFAEPFSYPKIFLTKVLMIIGLVTWALILVWRKTVAARKFPLGLPLLFLTFVVLLSCLNSPVPKFSLQQAEYFLCGPAWALFVAWWARGEVAACRLAAFAAIAATVVAGIAVAQWWGHDPLLFGGHRIEWGTMVPRMRLYSTFGNPNFVAGYLVGAIFSALGLGMTTFRLSGRVAWCASALLMLASIIGTGSRGAWFGLVAGLMTAWLAWRFGAKSSGREGLASRSRRNPGLPQIIASLLPVPLCLMVLAAVSLTERLLRQVEGRFYLWRIGWSMFLERPVMGSGCGTFQLGFLGSQARFLAENPAMVRHWINVHQLHNDPLQLLSETGLMGLAALAWVLWTYGREVAAVLDSSRGGSSRVWVSMGVGGVTAILADSFFNFQLAIPPTFLLLSTLFAFPALLSAGVPAHRSRGPLLETQAQLSSWGPPHDRQPETPRSHIALRVVLSVVVLFAAGLLLRPMFRRAEAELNYARGLRLENLEEFAIAEDTYRKALLLDAENDRLHFALARVLYFTNRLPEALREASLAERTYRDSHLEVLKARIQDRMGLVQPALATYRHALWLDPTLKTVQADIDRLQK